MAKKYDITSKSDMRKFQRDLKKDIMKQAHSEIMKGKYDVECPHCQNNVNIPVGKSNCPFCHNQIDFKLNIE